VRPDGEEIPFDVDAFRKHCLLEGLDDIGITLNSSEKISDFEARQKLSMPWMQGARV
jgi:3-isopropylmalate dehydratase small subunit